MKLRLAMSLVLAALAAAGAAYAFGTVSGVTFVAEAARQNAEHERITRLALGCGAASLDGAGACFGARTLDTLAGEWAEGRPVFGAVGGPDRSDKVFKSPPHCDNGDFLDGVGYPALNRDGVAPGAQLQACRVFANGKLDEAVADAGAVLDAKGVIRPSQVGADCVFVLGIPGRAKCNALEAFGIALHTSQDFYAHTNWADRPDPKRPIGADNPPGLGNSGPAPWISLRAGAAQPLPKGLMSGCFGLPNEAKACAYMMGDGARQRVMHAVLNKDTGTITPGFIGDGTSPRGAVEDNFARAVRAAIADTRDKWALLQERLTARYGPVRAARITCVLKADDPITACAGR